MADKITNELMFEVLKKIQSTTEIIENDIRDIKFRLAQVEERQIHRTGQMDRIDDRLRRIEKRLELVDA